MRARGSGNRELDGHVFQVWVAGLHVNGCGCEEPGDGRRFDLDRRGLEGADLPGSGSGPNPRDVNSRLFLEVLKAIAIAVPRTGIDEEVVEVEGVPGAREPGRAQESDGDLHVLRGRPRRGGKVGGRIPSEVGPDAECARRRKDDVRRRRCAPSRVGARPVRRDVSEPPEAVVARIEQIEADASRVRIPRRCDDVLESVVQDGHPQLRDRGFARRVHRITVRGSEIPDRPTPDVHVKGARPRSRDAGRVSGRGPIPEMEVREWKPGILFHVVDERLDGSRPAQHHRDEANRYDKSPRAAHDPSPRSRGRRPHAPCEFRMRGPAI